MQKRKWIKRICNALFVSSTIVFGGIHFVGESQANKLTLPAVKQRTPQKIELVIGNSRIIETPLFIGRASIANPDVADTVVVSGKQIYVVGKTVGVTNLTLWEKRTNQVFAVFEVRVSPDLSGLKEHLHRVLPDEGEIKLMANHDNVTLWGTVSNSTRLSKALALAEAYAPKKVINLLEVGGVHQVMLDVRVAEMNRQLLRRLGVNITAATRDGASFGVTKLNNISNIVKFQDATVAPNFPIPNSADPFGMILSQTANALFRLSSGDVTINGFLDALKENQLVKVLAEPTLTTLSGKEASFLAGGEFPFPVPQSFAVTTIRFKKFGVGLNFKPVVLTNNKISLDVAPEVSQLDFVNSVEINGFLIPSITTRRAATSIELDDGQSFAIAGLIQENIREQISKYPVLGDIPILGTLFRSSSFQQSQTELVIFVTVHLVKPLNVKNQTIPDFVPPNDFEFYLNGQIEGEESPKFLPSHRTPSIPRPVSMQDMGLEGEFGHTNRVPAENLLKAQSSQNSPTEQENVDSQKTYLQSGERNMNEFPLQKILKTEVLQNSHENLIPLGLDGEFGHTFHKGE